MKIGRTLLLAFLGLSLLSATLMTALAYTRSRNALEREIRHNLRARASALMQQIDTMLFERMQNVSGWSRLEVMQDARIGDVDKRLSHLLTDVRSAYGDVYTNILCVKDGRILAASTPALIGRAWGRKPTWLTAHLQQGDVQVTEPEYRSPDQTRLALRAIVADKYSHGKLGELYGIFNWDEVQSLMDKAVAGGTGQLVQYAVLLDASGRIIAASGSLPGRGILLSKWLAGWRQAGGADGTFTRDDSKTGLGRVEVGYATSTGYQQFGGFGWQVLVIEPTAVAFGPVFSLLWGLLGLLFLTMVFAGGVAILIARRLAQPIQQLTFYTRRFRAGVDEPPKIFAGGGEIGELSRAFSQMIADLRVSQDRLVQAGKLTVVGEMAAVMAHEVRTPLGILKSSGQLLARERNLSPEGREMVGFILSETERLNRLITTLIECARPRPPQFRSADVHAIIRRSLELLEAQAAKRSIRLERDLNADPSELICDAEQLLQVVLNLVLNAVQVLRQDGVVRISTRISGDDLVIEVADNGPGIPAEKRARIFDPFVTFREGGIGLGLTVVQQTVRQHGGNVEVGASGMGGALFRISLPRSRKEELPA